MRYVEDIAGLGMADAEEAGGKGANMGEMVAAGLPVPPGFVVLRDSYLASMRGRGGGRRTQRRTPGGDAAAGDPGRFDEMCAEDAGPGVARPGCPTTCASGS